MLFRAISEPPVPDQGPHDSDRSELHEGQPPALMLDQLEDQRRTDRGANSVADKGYAQSSSLVRRGKPPGNTACDVGERACLTRAEKESHQNQRRETRRRGSQRGEYRPPQNDAS